MENELPAQDDDLSDLEEQLIQLVPINNESEDNNEDDDQNNDVLNVLVPALDRGNKTMIYKLYSLEYTV